MIDKNSLNKNDYFEAQKKELSYLAKHGVGLYLNDRPSNPFKIAKTVCSVREQSVTYMADYIADEDGHLSEVNFNKVKFDKKR